MHEIKDNYDRVTAVLSPFSGLDRIDQDVLRMASQRGTTAHAIIDKMIESPSFFCAPMMEKMVNEYARNTEHAEKEIILVQGFIQSFERWADGKKFSKKPERFYEDEYKITGECDQLYYEDDRLILVDFKTPVSESKTWMLQATAYSFLAAANGYNLKRLEFIQLCRKGGIAKTYVYESDWPLFEACLDTYRYFYKTNQRDLQLDYI